VHCGLAVLDDVQRVGDVAHPHNVLRVLKVELLHRRRERLALRVGQAAEDRD